jgi:hypothetical protein
MLNKDLIFDSLKFDNNDNFNMPNLNLEKFNIQNLDIQYQINEQLESHTKKFMENNEYEDIEEIEIPMIFHVVYNNGDNYQIGDDSFKLNQQLIQTLVVDQLNEDYNLENEDRFDTPEIWQELMADFKIRFHINKVIFVNGYNECDSDNMEGCNQMKFDKNGGSDVIDPELNLNVWIVYISPFESGGSIAGYAYYASVFKQQPELDGYVLNILGLNSRTSTHEIGHWMNLKHIWGEGKGDGSEDECNNDNDDALLDTPNSNTNHIECGSSVNCSYPATSSCGSPDMFMNYMSYGTERYMFTKDQMLRARAVFAEGGPRHSMVTRKKSTDDDDNDNNNNVFILCGLAAAFICLILMIYFIFRSVYRCILKYRLREMHELTENAENMV